MLVGRWICLSPEASASHNSDEGGAHRCSSVRESRYNLFGGTHNSRPSHLPKRASATVPLQLLLGLSWEVTSGLSVWPLAAQVFRDLAIFQIRANGTISYVGSAPAASQSPG
jgi:hypothetical protein